MQIEITALKKKLWGKCSSKRHFPHDRKRYVRAAWAERSRKNDLHAHSVYLVETL